MGIPSAPSSLGEVLANLIQEIARLKLPADPLGLTEWTHLFRQDQGNYTPTSIRLRAFTIQASLQDLFSHEHLSAKDDLLARILSQPKSEALLFLHRDGGTGGPAEESKEEYLQRMVLIPILTEYFHAVNGFRFVADKAKAAGARLDAIVSGAIPRMQIVSAMWNVRLTGACRYDFQNGIVLRAVTRSESEQWLNSDIPMLPREVIFELRCALETDVNEQVHVPIRDPERAKRVTSRIGPTATVDIATAQQFMNIERWLPHRRVARFVDLLCVEGKTECSVVYSQMKILGHAQGGQISGGHFRQHELVIDSIVAEKLKALWKSMSAEPNAEYFDFPLHRLAQAYARTNKADAIIDCWIGLESVFSTGKSQEQLRYAIPLRIAYFLGNSAVERKDLCENVRHAYDWRSAVVHGNAKEQEKLARRQSRMLLYAGVAEGHDPETRTSMYLQLLLERALRKILGQSPVSKPAEIVARIEDSIIVGEFKTSSSE